MLLNLLQRLEKKSLKFCQKNNIIEVHQILNLKGLLFLFVRMQAFFYRNKLKKN